ncbi:MAG: thioredoxin [Eubacterium sp.]|nr:thioredoxin [Eubacterium sp.]
MVNKIQNNDFSKVLEEKIALVDFSATWCGPCQMLAPVLEELSEEMDVPFYAVDADENMNLVQQYRVINIPAVMIFKNGEKVAEQVGFQPKEQLKQWIGEQM